MSWTAKRNKTIHLIFLQIRFLPVSHSTQRHFKLEYIIFNKQNTNELERCNIFSSERQVILYHITETIAVQTDPRSSEYIGILK